MQTPPEQTSQKKVTEKKSAISERRRSFLKKSLIAVALTPLVGVETARAADGDDAYAGDDWAGNWAGTYVDADTLTISGDPRSPLTNDRIFEVGRRVMVKGAALGFKPGVIKAVSVATNTTVDVLLDDGSNLLNEALTIYPATASTAKKSIDGKAVSTRRDDISGAPISTLDLYIKSAVVTLRSCGAVGDGSANDDAALTRAIATGVRIQGTDADIYKFTSGKTLSNYYQIIDLNGAELKPVGTFDAFDLTQSSTGIINGSIDASELSGRVICNSTAIQDWICENLLIHHSKAGYTAVQLKDAFTSWIRRLRITNMAGPALNLYTSTPGTPTNSMHFTDCDFSGGTGAVDVVLLEGISGSHFVNASFQNNATGATDVRIKSTVNAGVSTLSFINCYFEVGTSAGGHNIYIGDPTSGANAHMNFQVIGGKMQTSRQPIRIGTNVNDDCLISGVEFTATPGAPSNAILVSGSANPRVVNCTGSLSSALGSGRIQIGKAKIFYGSGTPESAVVGNVGDLYLRTDTGGTTLYIKEFNNGSNTGWIVHPGWCIAPSSAGGAGIAGQMAYSSGYFYICVAANTWRRAAVSSW